MKNRNELKELAMELQGDCKKEVELRMNVSKI